MATSKSFRFSRHGRRRRKGKSASTKLQHGKSWHAIKRSTERLKLGK